MKTINPLHCLGVLLEFANIQTPPVELIAQRAVDSETQELLLRKVIEGVNHLNFREYSDRAFRWTLSNEIAFEVGAAFKIAMALLDVDDGFLRIAKKRIPTGRCPTCRIKIPTESDELAAYFTAYGCDLHRWEF